MATYSSWVTIFWSIFDAYCTSKHPFFSGFEAEKACVLYMPAWYTHRFTVYRFGRGLITTFPTRCVCGTLMPAKRQIFEKYELDI